MTPSFTWSKRLAFTWSKRLAGVLAVTCLLAGQAAGVEDKVLNVYNWVDYIGETTIADFEKETGIKVVYDTYDASETVDAKLLAGEAGRCPGVLQCPYHGWTYDLDGSLKAVAQERSFARLDKAALGLQPIEHEVFEGFVFIRFRGDGPSVSERFAPYAAELAHHRLGEMVPVEGLWLEETGVDWKNVWDNYLEGYHFATGHPGLSDLMGHGYDYDTGPGQVARLSHSFRAKPSKTWSARHYRKLLPDCTHLPEALRQTWSYFFLFPAMAFDIYPDKMDVFQILPTGPGQCTLRGRSYALPDERREMRAARYLNLRLNIAVQNEDNELTRSVQQGLASSSYSAGVVSEIETVLHGFQNWVRAALPVATLGAAPAPGSVAARNRALANSPQD